MQQRTTEGEKKTHLYQYMRWTKGDGRGWPHKLTETETTTNEAWTTDKLRCGRGEAQMWMKRAEQGRQRRTKASTAGATAVHEASEAEVRAVDEASWAGDGTAAVTDDNATAGKPCKDTANFDNSPTTKIKNKQQDSFFFLDKKAAGSKRQPQNWDERGYLSTNLNINHHRTKVEDDTNEKLMEPLIPVLVSYKRTGQHKTTGRGSLTVQ
jgi:hypothetical protein